MKIEFDVEFNEQGLPEVTSKASGISLEGPGYDALKLAVLSELSNLILENKDISAQFGGTPHFYWLQRTAENLSREQYRKYLKIKGE